VKTLLSWSSGKDSAWTLHVLRQQPDVEVTGLVTTVNREFARIAMHGVREELLERQAEAAGLPLWRVPLPFPCSNADYEAAFRSLLERASRTGVEAMAFGDLFLEDIRDYRVQLLKDTGIEPLFPIWGSDTAALAREMIDAGLHATLTCVDTDQCDASFVGRSFDAALLEDLPKGVDPLGENGEFHTFANAGPCFSATIPVETGETIERDGFVFVDLLPE